ncbi:MAG TPA: Asp-tRNA(Asn)/Glu-tRNA(Gln) amidotransferase subunit GatB [Gemmatimonadaceae bacterium]|jgi:aspartyl-tRNA(Asn)/glutamyl-tRNA(Gln) amidotransferase subunit B|nr:Asp-tRNA(Asn)/Glu-tRNA(Gln) amidotransferase subunit GatB [Gemmatimonadaceae bacterium]
MSRERFEMVVGLEVHVQLKTRTKAFCACSTDFGAPPNVNTCPVCLALPGALPVLNERAVELATRAALGLGCQVNPVSVFARKNYFYPDLPKGYQISQFDQPLATGGFIVIAAKDSGAELKIGITRLHMEEDAGKSIHDRYPGATAIDLNRAGVPLIEIVSEPDIRSSADAGAYLRTLKQILQYLEVSDVSMEEGSLRVDANISVRPHGQSRLGTKTEVKNMNSFSGVERALDAEFERQCALLDSGGKVEQQTLLWDGAREVVRPSRTKEGSHDYRYFPEPDLRPLMLDDKWIGDARKHLPELPDARKKRLGQDFGIAPIEIEQLTAAPALAEYFEAVARASGDGKAAYNWVMGEVLAVLKATGNDLSHFRVRPADLAQLLSLVRDGTVSHTAAKRVFALMVETGKPPAQVAADEGLSQVGDEDAIATWVDEVLVEHPEEAKRYLAGEKKLQGVLVGFVMKKSKGRADPKRVNQLLSTRGG